ncbi:hypothetical protein BH09PSE6_BH09PSE6_09760 [soil metagenome]
MLPDTSNLDSAEPLDAAWTLVQRCLNSPSPTDGVLMEAAIKTLVGLPVQANVNKQVLCLLSVAQVLYIRGRAIDALEFCERAVNLARRPEAIPLIRRALTTHGVMLADCGDITTAVSVYAEALEIAHSTSDRLGECTVWNNLGVALLYAAQYEEAVECFERTLAVVDESTKEGLSLAANAASNISLSCLHMEEIPKGLRAARRAITCSPDPTSASELYHRVLTETYYTRLLLEVENVEKARERSELARGFAKRANSDRAMLAADFAEGLYQVHAGFVDVGMTRLYSALERARLNRGSLRDGLIALVKAHEVAGEPEKALSHLRELMLFTRKVQQDNVLSHHRRHLATLDLDEAQSSDPTKTSVGLLIRREAVLKGQLAQRDLVKSQMEMLERLAVTAELRDDSTGEHSYRVGRLAALLAADYGCDDHVCFMIEVAARLHDIGKIGIPDGILLKPGKLNAAERQIMETHTTVGAELLAQSNVPHMQMAEEIARHHHEWWDGSGYPHGIRGTAVPISARIAALADVFDALTHRRPYKDAWPVAHALEEMTAYAGKQFDPELTDIFVKMIRRLQREHGDLDLLLGEAAQQSPFVQARKKIALALRRTPAPADKPSQSQGTNTDAQRFDSQR